MEEKKNKNKTQNKKVLAENKETDALKKDDIETREINLDELYDGVINNTVVIDPVTKDEVFVASKRSHHTFLFIILAIIILIILYLVTDKDNIFVNKEPVVTTKKVTTITTTVSDDSMTCTYQHKDSIENTNATFNVWYLNGSLNHSELTYSIVSNENELSTTTTNLMSEYENFYIANEAVNGFKFTYDKDNKGFTFIMKTEYQKASFDDLKFNDGKTIMIIRPSKDDTLDVLKKAYQKLDYTCVINQESSKIE